MANKLQVLADTEGMTIDELLEESVSDSVMSGICTNKDCSYTTNVEPDCRNGYCEECRTQTVCSPLVLAGLI